MAEAEAEVDTDAVAAEDVPADALEGAPEAPAPEADDVNPAWLATITQAHRMKLRTTENRCPWSPAPAF